jgi:hypothetical protein
VGSKTFEYDGEQFAYLTDPNDMSVDEMDVVLEWLVDVSVIDMEDTDASIRVLNQPQHRMKLLKVLLWASIHRGRPNFTIAEAGAVKMRVAGSAVTSSGLARKAPADHQKAAAAVMSPTSAGKPRTRKPASRTSTAGGAATARRSRTSTASAPGNSAA